MERCGPVWLGLEHGGGAGRWLISSVGVSPRFPWIGCPPQAHLHPVLGGAQFCSGGTPTIASCSAMVHKKARLCGLNETGVQLANFGHCEICSDAGRPDGWRAWRT
jgi:hypothetical protein